MAVLKAVNLKKYYGEEPNLVRALDGVNLEVKNGEFLAIIGASGSGKSTLLHMLGGLDSPTGGTILIEQQDISKMTPEQLAIYRRRKIGFVFQNYNLVPILNTYENIVLPIELDEKKVDESYIKDIIKTLGLSDKEAAMPGMLSGGQQQRVAIARALATKPSIILADEPTGNLDSKTSQDVLDVLRLSLSQFNQTLVLITHNEQIAQRANRIIRIEDGKVAGRAVG